VARSYRYRRFGFPLGLTRSLVLAATGDPDRAGRISHYITTDELRTPGVEPVPEAVLAATLVARGWSPRLADRWFAAANNWSRHENAWARRAHYRAYRHRANALVAAGRAEEVGGYTKTGGWLTW
jgi:hypothetical protein